MNATISNLRLVTTGSSRETQKKLLGMIGDWHPNICHLVSTLPMGEPLAPTHQYNARCATALALWTDSPAYLAFISNPETAFYAAKRDEWTVRPLLYTVSSDEVLRHRVGDEVTITSADAPAQQRAKLLEGIQGALMPKVQTTVSQARSHLSRLPRVSAAGEQLSRTTSRWLGQTIAESIRPKREALFDGAYLCGEDGITPSPQKWAEVMLIGPGSRRVIHTQLEETGVSHYAEMLDLARRGNIHRVESVAMSLAGLTAGAGAEDIEVWGAAGIAKAVRAREAARCVGVKPALGRARAAR